MIKKIFITLGALLFIITCVQAKDLRFVQVAETMFSPANVNSLESCIADINSLKKIDFVVFTGDNISSAKKEYLREFLKITKKIKAPVYIVIGDRDVSKEKGLNKETYREECFKYLGFGQSLKSNYVFKKKGLVFIVVDGAKEFITAANGYYKQDTLDWLDNRLKKYKNRKVVLLQHFPIIECDISERNTYKVELYKEVIKKHDNILAIISGHFGENDEGIVEDKNYYISPAYSKTNEYKIFDIPESFDAVYTQLRIVE